MEAKSPIADRHPVLVVMGVSGSGKSTVAELLAEQLGWEFREGDDLHPPENVAKMASGRPLNDEDRAPWLALIAEWIGERTCAGQTGVVTCSALKRSYREVLRSKAAPDSRVIFVHLVGTRHRIDERLSERTGHFMASSMLASQLATLEPLEPDEDGIRVDVGPPPDEIVARILEELRTGSFESKQA